MKTVPNLKGRENRQILFAFPPKAQNQLIEAGLLARLTFAGLLIPITFRFGGSGQWRWGAKAFPRLTVAGTAPVFHRIPF